MCVCLCGVLTQAGGLDAIFALPLRLDYTQASLHVALEELGGVPEEGLQVSVRVVLLVLIQLRQALTDTHISHKKPEDTSTRQGKYMWFSSVLSTSFVFSLEPIFLKISDRMSLTLALDILSSLRGDIQAHCAHRWVLYVCYYW